MTKSFSTQIEKRHDALWISLPDSIDMDNHQRIQEMIEPEMRNGCDRVVLDFSRTTALFSSGLGLIIRLKKLVEQKGGKIYLVNVRDKIYEGFENVGLNKTFEVFMTENEFVNNCPAN